MHTLNPQERTATTARLRHLLEQLLPYCNGSMVKSLPDPIRKALYDEPFAQPITSSGLEYVYQIANRIDFAVYGLGDDSFDVIDNQFYSRNAPPAAPVATVASIPSPTPQPISQPLSVPIQRQQPPSTPPNDLDFGPFDPRRK
jgi:hypothetical protein